MSFNFSEETAVNHCVFSGLDSTVGIHTLNSKMYVWVWNEQGNKSLGLEYKNLIWRLNLYLIESNSFSGAFWVEMLSLLPYASIIDLTCFGKGAKVLNPDSVQLPKQKHQQDTAVLSSPKYTGHRKIKETQ